MANFSDNTSRNRNETDGIEHRTASPSVEEAFNISYQKQKVSAIASLAIYSSSDSNSSNNSDNSSELDEDETNEEQIKCNKRIEEIESEFYILKKMLITEKIKEIDQQIAEVKSKKSNEYKLHLQKLINTKNSQCQVAILKKEFEKENLYHKHKAQEQSILQNYKNNKEIAYETIKTGLDKLVQQLSKEYYENVVDSALWPSHRLLNNVPRRGRGRGRGRKRGRGRMFYEHRTTKPETISGVNPPIVYMLKEHEIIEDWAIIKTSLLTLEHKEKVDQYCE